MNFVKIILKILTGKASGQLYFILVLFQLTLLTPIILRCQKSKVLNICCLMITPVYLCVLYGIQIYLNKQIIFYETFFPAWFIFYYVGIYLKQNKYFETKENNVNLLKSIFWVFIALLMSVFECNVLLNLGLPDGFATSQIKFSSFCYAFAMINLLFSIKNIMPLQSFPQWMIELGNKSYGIYYVHCLWLVFLNKILLMIPIINTLLPLLQLLEASCAILISYGIIILVIRLVGKERAKFFFGF